MGNLHWLLTSGPKWKTHYRDAGMLLPPRENGTLFGVMRTIYSRIAAVLFLGLSVSLFGDDVATEQSTQKLALEGQKWAGFDLFGCSLNLESKQWINWYMFHRNGMVSATVGEKNVSMSAPLWGWRISGKWLQIFDYDGKVLFQMRPLKVTAKEFTVENARGETEVFEIQRNEIPAKGSAPDKKGN